MIKTISSLALFFIIAPVAETKATFNYDTMSVDHKLESLGYFTFQKSFFTTCESKFPELANEIEHSFELLQPYLDKLETYFTHSTAPQQLTENFLDDSYKAHTQQMVNDKFESGEYGQENCKFAIWSIREQGIDQTIEQYLNE